MPYLNINDVLISKYIADWAASARPVKRLLDLGCGKRPYARYYEPICDEVFALDFERRCDRKVPFVIGDASTLPFSNSAFDAIICTEVLEHIPDIAKAISELARVLQPGGTLLLTVPFNQHLHEVPQDYYRFTPWGLRFLAGEDFTFLDVTPRGGPLARAMRTLIEIDDRAHWLWRNLPGRRRSHSETRAPVHPLAAAYLQLSLLTTSRTATACADLFGARDALRANPMGYNCLLKRRQIEPAIEGGLTHERRSPWIAPRFISK